MKPKCNYCSKKTQSYNIMKCKYCNKKYCMSCYSIEMHNCSHYNNCKTEEQTKLEKVLLSGKENESKNYTRMELDDNV